MNLQFSVWAATENYLDLRNSLAEEVKQAFDRESIEIPFPHRVLVTRTLADPPPASGEGGV